MRPQSFTVESMHRLRRHARALAIVACALIPASAPVSAQGAPSPTAPVEIGGVTFTGSFRTRLESWDWFGGTANGTYTYPGTLIRIGVGRLRKKYDLQVELALPLLFGLPEQPVGAVPPGLGANYFVANDRSTSAAMLFAKQAFVRLKDFGGVAGQSLKVGRMEFFDGAEVSPRNATLAAVKRDRIGARLLANFGFTHVQRSFDGAQYALDRPAMNVTILAARPTRGVFQVDGWGELPINVLYAALTRQVGGAANAGEWRLFGIGYSDDREGVLKTDNRSFVARHADREHLTIGTAGGHYLRVIETGHGPIDVLLWGASQFGSWGEIAHRAGSFAAEAGWQPTRIWMPWIRGGLNYASGDHEAGDATHGTFFQLLPTPRLYARFPFFNLMNTSDAFGALTLRPSSGVTIRTDVHSIRLADGHDLWYQGGGAFQPATFGYIGQPAGGHQGLAMLYDASADIAVSPHISVTGYYGYAAGGPASAASYPTHNNAALGYLEWLVRF
jgi:hypothetical protein